MPKVNDTSDIRDRDYVVTERMEKLGAMHPDFSEGSMHPEDCRCEKCKFFWACMDPLSPLGNNPFSQDELYEFVQRRLEQMEEGGWSERV